MSEEDLGMTNVSFDGRFLFRHKSCEVRWGVIRKKQSDLRYNADMTGGGLVGSPTTPTCNSKQDWQFYKINKIGFQMEFHSNCCI